MSSRLEREVLIHDTTQIDELPELAGIDTTGVTLENPGSFDKGTYVIRIDEANRTARIDAVEPKS